jgi:hypothetical protein
MDSIRINITGDRQVGLRFDAFPDVLYDDLRREIEGLSGELYALVQAATPTATGELRSQERLRIFTDKTRITGYVDVAAEKGSKAFAKAGALEYGASRPTQVSPHTMGLDHYWAHKLSEPESVLVDAYVRTPNIAEYAFERTSLASLQPEVLARLNAVVEKTVAGANA